MYFSSASRGLWEQTQALRQQLRADHEAVAAMCLKVGIRSKELREAKEIEWRGEHYLSPPSLSGVTMTLSTLSEDEQHTIFGHWRNLLVLQARGLSATDLAKLGTLGPMLPALDELCLFGAAGPDGVQRLAAGLGAGALPAMTKLSLYLVHVGDAGAEALAAALGRGALPRLECLTLHRAAIGDAGLVALTPALRRRPPLRLDLCFNPFGDEGLAALLAPPPLPAGALPSPTGVLTKLQQLRLDGTQVSDAGCAALTAALERGVLPAIQYIGLTSMPASAAARAAVKEALDKHELTRVAAQRDAHELTRVAAQRDALARETDAFIDAFVLVPVHLVPAHAQFLAVVLVMALLLAGALVLVVVDVGLLLYLSVLK